MKLSDFRIGKDFVHEGKVYRCTDIGTRCVLSIEVVRGWMNGPPYAQHETYWDEYCLPHCTPWQPKKRKKVLRA